MDCTICTLPYTARNRSKVKCPTCSSEACMTCIQKYLISKKAYPECMSCHAPWNEIKYDILPVTFVNNHLMDVIVDYEMRIEKQKLPERQDDLARFNAISDFQEVGLYVDRAIDLFEMMHTLLYPTYATFNLFYEAWHSKMVMVSYYSFCRCNWESTADGDVYKIDGCYRNMYEYSKSTYGDPNEAWNELNDILFCVPRDLRGPEAYREMQKRLNFCGPLYLSMNSAHRFRDFGTFRKWGEVNNFSKKEQKTFLPKEVLSWMGEMCEMCHVDEMLPALLNLREDLRSKVQQLRDVNPKTIKRFTKKCITDGCPGFLDCTTFSCSLCRTVCCQKCLDPLTPNHACDSDTVQTLALIDKTTTTCPGCAMPIEKNGPGCSLAWCTQCHQMFDFETGEVRNGKNHNPEYYDFLRTRMKELPRVDTADIPNEIHDDEERKFWILRLQSTDRKDEMHHTFITRFIDRMNDLQWATGIRPWADADDDDIRDMRIYKRNLAFQYLRKEITETEWRSNLKREMRCVEREIWSKKNLRALQTCARNLIDQYLQTENFKIVEEMKALANVFNEQQSQMQQHLKLTTKYLICEEESGIFISARWRKRKREGEEEEDDLEEL